ncbi:MAG: Transcriptional regulator KdgR [candidate division TA06 bacterium ADurb.Bin131]|uniref:Transcriptional regulator KdgR n=1 Tax=candidate division TA06 bacterium ADurb.Bin131 TaxID=1852827 RepID=A0A1V6C517_UNCT6|nr:MAG: Transcriptional regulator KdgR [candidate division TA06 bacterium ADurb.Bin131]HOC02155.1 IclR family transcriptional regulator [bacterium]HQL65456.1 IclR family transcriptional regulator [bacterium]
MKKIAVVDKIVKIIEIVAENNGIYTMSDISKALNMQSSTTYNLLQNLVISGYLEKDQNSKKYKIGNELLELIKPVSKRKIIITASEKVIKELAEKVQESVVLAIFYNGERYIIAKAEYTDHLVNVNLDLFQKTTCYETVTGRILLAYLSETELKEYVRRHGYPEKKWNGILNFTSLNSAIKEIQKKQIVINKTNEVSAVAVPVFGPDKSVWASLGIYLPTTRFTNSKKNQLIEEVKRAAGEISKNLIEEKK